MADIIFQINDIHCEKCVEKIRQALENLGGLEEVHFDLDEKIVRIEGEAPATALASLGVTSTAAELNLLDGSVAGTITNSKGVIYGASGEVNATTLQIGGTSITKTAAEINALSDGTLSAGDAMAFAIALG